MDQNNAKNAGSSETKQTYTLEIFALYSGSVNLYFTFVKLTKIIYQEENGHKF